MANACAATTLGIGAFVCFLAASVPFWKEGQFHGNGSIINSTDIRNVTVNGTDMTVNGTDINEIKELKTFHGGVFWYYFETDDGQEYGVYELSNGADYETVTLWLCVTQVGLSVLCAIACFCCLRCSDMSGSCGACCLGLLTFIAGLCGISVTILTSQSSDAWGLTTETTGLSYELTGLDNDWALYVYAAGSSIITVSSFVLCCSSGDKYGTGYGRMAGEKSLRKVKILR